MQNEEYQVSLAESHTLMLLGMIAVRAGFRNAIYDTGRKVSDGSRSVVISRQGHEGDSVDIIAWLGQAWFSDPTKPLDRMWDFRNHLFHGSCFVDREDGALTIHDSRQKHCVLECKFKEDVTTAEYTAVELATIAGWFVNLDPSRSIRIEFSWTEQCTKCGATRTSEDPSGPLCACSQEN